MSRQSAAIRNMSLLCESKALNKDIIIIRARALLDTYRRIATVILEDTEMTVSESCTHYAGNDSYLSDIKAGLSYLADFEPEHKKKEFEAKVSRLFEGQWMIELIEMALERVRRYSFNGKDYYEILYKSYFVKHRNTNDDLQEMFNVEHSALSDYKREAVLLFGIYLWGYIIPSFYQDSDPAE